MLRYTIYNRMTGSQGYSYATYAEAFNAARAAGAAWSVRDYMAVTA